MTLFSLISVLISLAAVASYLNYRYIRLPTTIGVMLVALVASLTIIVAGPMPGVFAITRRRSCRRSTSSRPCCMACLHFPVCSSIHVLRRPGTAPGRRG